jgi:hypothetical protein
MTLRKSHKSILYSSQESRGLLKVVRRTVRTAARPEHAILGALLRELRESLQLSQRDVAKILDRTQAYIWKVEQGMQHIDLPTLIDFANLLGVRASELVRKVETRVAKQKK